MRIWTGLISLAIVGLVNSAQGDELEDLKNQIKILQGKIEQLELRNQGKKGTADKKEIQYPETAAPYQFPKGTTLRLLRETTILPAEDSIRMRDSMGGEEVYASYDDRNYVGSCEMHPIIPINHLIVLDSKTELVIEEPAQKSDIYQSFIVRTVDGRFSAIISCKTYYITYQNYKSKKIYHNGHFIGRTLDLDPSYMPDEPRLVFLKQIFSIKFWDSKITEEKVAGGRGANQICSTADAKFVQFQIRASSTSKVECFCGGAKVYASTGTYMTSFADNTTYNFATGRWSCFNWTRGNPDYKITIRVDGVDHFTDETMALTNPC